MARIAALLLTLGLLLGACTQVHDEPAARAVALKAYSTVVSEEGLVQDPFVIRSSATTRGGRSGWEVEVSGRVVMPGLPDGLTRNLVFFVDGMSGGVEVVEPG